MVAKLYADPSSPRTQRLLAIAQTNEVEIEVVCDDAAKKKPSYGKIPVLDTGKGCIFSTNAISRYLARIRPDIGLYGQNFFESGEVDSWIDYCTHELEVPLHAWTGPLEGQFPEMADASARAKQDTASCLTLLNKHLTHRTYMVGESLTLSDIQLCSVLHAPIEKHGILDVLMKDLQHLKRWYTLVVQQPGFKHAFGKDSKFLTAGKGGKGAQQAAAPGKKSEGGGKKQDAAANKGDASPKGGNKKDAKGQGKDGKKDNKGEKKGADAGKKSSQGGAGGVDPAKLKKVLKEGGKRGVEIEGAADLGGLTFFCTTVVEPDGDLDMVEKSVDAMNAESDPNDEERKGGAGGVGKIIFSAGDHLAMVAYVPEKLHSKTDATTWLNAALKRLGEDCTREDETKYIVKKANSGKTKAFALLKCDPSKGRYAIKVKDDALTKANGYLKENGLFPDDSDDEDEMVFGDDDFPS